MTVSDRLAEWYVERIERNVLWLAIAPAVFVIGLGCNAWDRRHG